MSKIAIIVLHFGDKKNTHQCLKSLKRLKYDQKKIKTIVIDNDKQNLGFAGGVNKGLKVALKGESIKYFLLLNNDLVVDQNLLISLINCAKGKNIGILGCIITYFRNPNKIWFAGGHLNKVFCFTKHLYINKRLTSRIQLSNADFITGACMFIKREIFEKIGLFDEDYFLYWEDVDFCQRALKAGFKILCVNQPLVQHKISSTTGIEGSNKLSTVRAYYFARNPFLFMKKNNLPILTGLIGQLFIRLPYYFFTLSGLNSFYQYLKGLWDGIRFLYLH